MIVIAYTGNAGMNTGAHLDGGVVIAEGAAGEFAGAYMKKGMLILKDVKVITNYGIRNV
ncbi:MAG: hypothetical protein KKD69_09345 [Euryarchaeota archaeon]|nr:hypothetical protein [Euryarchaeota archaeon]MCG2728246.1 hypothetical protein [Candidatus Methanoperedenaceae archaeon]